MAKLMIGILFASAFVMCHALTAVMTVTYCPTYFSTSGATVSVDVPSGKLSVLGKFSWGNWLKDECDILGDPAVAFARVGDSNQLTLDFFSDFAAAITVDVNKAKVLRTVKPTDPFFVGFTNFYVNTTKGVFEETSILEGLSGTATQNGLCNDGCFQFGTLDEKGRYTKKDNVLFKGLMDDADFHHSPATNKMYIQMSYDLRAPPQRCVTPHDYSLCLLTIDTNTGATLSSLYTNFTVYKYDNRMSPSNTVLTFVEGLAGCPSFAFAHLNVTSAQAQVISCMNATIGQGQWISSFSADGSTFITASGDAEGESQLLIIDVATGKPLVDVSMNSLGKTLGAQDALFDVWSINFVN